MCLATVVNLSKRILLFSWKNIRLYAMTERQTSIRVSENPVWSYLNGQKRAGDSMDDVLRRELELEDGQEAEA